MCNTLLKISRFIFFGLISCFLCSNVFAQSKSQPFSQTQPQPQSQYRDPTEPYETVQKTAAPVKQAKLPTLTAIMISGNKRTAVIDDSVVREGDKLGNKVIRQIGRYSVKLMENGNEITLYLFGTPLKEKKP